MTREEKFNDYEGFVAKFQPKKTTDDCYTPPAVYEAVKAWACRRYGIPYALPRREAVFIRALDAMRAEGKGAFGGALLISDHAAARKADAEQAVPHADAPTRVWELSDREKAIIKELNHNDDERPCAAP